MAVKVRQRRGAWWVFIDHQGRRRAKRCASKKAAELAADKIDAALRLGQVDVLDADRRPTPAPVPTFQHYAERWLAGAGVRLKAATIEQHATRLRVRLLPSLAGLPLTSITRERVRALLGEMVQIGNRRSKGRPVARGTVQGALNTLSAILSTAVEDGVMAVNPCTGMGRQLGQLGAREIEEIEVFGADELGRILAIAEADYRVYYAFIFCLARSGIRFGEAVGLEWRDVDFDHRVLLIRRSRRKARVSEPKNGKARRVDMSPQLTATLRTLQSIQEAEAVVNGTAAPTRAFSNPHGHPIHDDSFRQRVWAPALKRAGLRYRKPHTLRHTYASQLIEAGEPLTYIQQQLGHHSAAFTLRVYGHLLPRQGRRGVDVLDDVTFRNPAATASLVPAL
jgi:integrase